MSHGAWTAAQCAEVAVHKVIGPLEDQLQESAAPNAHEGLVIGGLAALQLQNEAFADLRAELKGERYPPKEPKDLLAELASLFDGSDAALVRLDLAPVVVHLPRTLVESDKELLGEQERFAKHLDPGRQQHLHEPYETSLLVLDTPGHLKLLPSSVPPEHFSSLVHSDYTEHQDIHWLQWPAVIVEQLLLGARYEKGAHAAYRLIRLAWQVGRAQLYMPQHRAHPMVAQGQLSTAEYHKQRRDRLANVDAAVKAEVQKALKNAATLMLGTKLGRDTIDWWVDQLRGTFTAAVARWEKSSPNNTLMGTRSPRLLSDAYIELTNTLLPVLLTAAQHLHNPQHSLGKSAFAPAARRQGERTTVFA